MSETTTLHTDAIPTPYLTTTSTTRTNFVTLTIAQSTETYTTIIDIALAPTQSSSSTADASNSTSKGLEPAQIGGIVAGVIVAIFLLTFVGCMMRRRHSVDYESDASSSDSMIKPELRPVPGLNDVLFMRDEEKGQKTFIQTRRPPSDAMTRPELRPVPGLNDVFFRRDDETGQKTFIQTRKRPRRPTAAAHDDSEDEIVIIDP